MAYFFYNIRHSLTVGSFRSKRSEDFNPFCQLSVNRIVEVSSLNEIHQRLIEIISLIEQNYGRDKITPNLHLSIHLNECSYDYGPLYAFWCFSFEKMNGILGSTPNSHRKIEPEIMRRLMNDGKINNIISSGIDMKGLELLDNRPSVGSLSATDPFDSEELKKFWIHSKNIQDSVITGSEAFPGGMLKPCSEDFLLSPEMLNLMVDYYNATYELLEFRKPFGEGSEESTIIRVKIKYGRCRIGSEIFGSTFSKFVTQDNTVDCYPGNVQFFFTHEVNLNGNLVKHHLAYIRWYKHTTRNNRYHFSIDDAEQTCNTELWDTEFYPTSRDCIIPVHHILCRFVPVKYQLSERRNAKVYLAVNPINRKYNIR